MKESSPGSSSPTPEAHASVMAGGPDSPEFAHAHARIVLFGRIAEPLLSLAQALSNNGYSVMAVSTSSGALESISQHRPHLMILDWDLTADTCSQLVSYARSLYKVPRMLALSTLPAEHQVIAGLKLGLDDYMAKPFSLPELVARVRALLRSIPDVIGTSGRVVFGCLRMDTDDGSLTVREQPVQLRSVELKLLEYFMRHPERVFGREHLLARVWGTHGPTDPRTVDVTVQRIRHALTSHRCERYLQTVRGVGYRLSDH